MFSHSVNDAFLERFSHHFHVEMISMVVGQFRASLVGFRVTDLGILQHFFCRDMAHLERDGRCRHRRNSRTKNESISEERNICKKSMSPKIH